MSCNQRTKDQKYDPLKFAASLSKLHIAVRTGNFSAVHAAIRAGADLNEPIPGSEKTSIHIAIVEKNVKMVKELIDAGIDLNVKGLKQTPLVSAVISGKTEVVKLLLDNGADINARVVNYDSALHVAAGKGNVDIAELLIDRGLNVNARNYVDETPLHSAVQVGKAKIVRLLLCKGVNVNAVSCFKCDEDIQNVKMGSNITAMYMASIKGNLEIVDMLIKAGANLDARSSDGYTALHSAVDRGQLKLLKMLLKAGADVNAQSNDGKTPLLSAVAEGKTDIVTELLKVKGIDFNILNDDQQTPLFLAAANGFLEIVQLLITKGAPINATVPYPDIPNCSVAPLEIALLKGKEDVAEFLIQDGADIHAKNLSDGMSAMASACCMQGFSPKLGKLLIEKGGDVNEKSHLDGASLLHMIVQADDDPVESVKFLVDHGAGLDVQDVNKRTPLHEAVDVGNIKIVEYLATKVKQIDPETLSAQTPLHFAVKKGHLKIADILLNHGANINAQDAKKRTVLHVAVAAKQSDTVKLLLKKKAVVNLKDNKEEHTPLFLATKKKDKKLVNLLLQYDADPNIGNVFGIMPIHVASKGGYIDIVRALLEKGAYFDITGGTEIFKGPPLMFAKKGGNAKIISLLELIECLFNAVIKNNMQQIKCYVKAGVIVNARNASGRTALHYAVDNRNVDAIKTLLVNGADISVESNIGSTPLHKAVTNQSMDIVEILLTHAKQLSYLKFNRLINAKIAEGGATVLHFAAENNCLNIVKLLIKNGAIYNTKNKSGKISSQLTTSEEIKILLNSVEKLFKAVEKDDSEEVLQILENNESAVNARDLNGGGTPLYWAVSKGYKDLANLLLANNADYFLVTNKGTTPLHIAASKGNLDLVKTLVTRVKNEHTDRASDFLDAQTVSGTTALHVASSVDVVKCLLQAGARYNIQNREDKTPLQTTANSDIQKLLEIIHKLFKDVKKGSSAVVSTLNGLEVEESRAVLNAQNEQGKTLVDVAVANGNVKIASKLLEKLKKSS